MDGLGEASRGSRKTLRPSSGVGGSLLCSAFNFSTCVNKNKRTLKLIQKVFNWKHISPYWKVPAFSL